MRFRRLFTGCSPTVAALLYGVNALTVATGFIVITLWGDKSMKKAAENQLRNDLAAAAAVISGMMVQYTPPVSGLLPAAENEPTGSYPPTAPVGAPENLRLTLVSRDGSVVWDTATNEPLENHLDRPEIKAAFNGIRDASDIRRSTVTGGDVMYYAILITSPSTDYVLRLACPIRRTVYYTQLWRTHSILAAAAVAAVVLGMTYFASSFIVHGINALRQEAHSLKGNNAHYHIPLSAPREVLLLQADMERMANELHRLERVRKDFVANVSHELKTPVTSIVGFSETLLDGVAAEDAHNFLRIINEQANRLMAIIEDLLTLSRLEGTSMKPEMARCDIASLTKLVVDNFVNKAQERGNTLTFSSNVKGAICMVNDKLYEEALGNIIDNAIKYCPSNSRIEVNVASNKTAGTEKFQGGKTNKSVCITVTDDGPGIPEKYRDRVFERFFRVDKGRSRGMGGTGLGLSISAHIVQSHGGTLRSTDRADGKNGAVFIMELPEISE